MWLNKEHIAMINKASNSRDESLNISFNKHRINRPQLTFYSADLVGLFKKTGLPVNTISYAEFLSEHFQTNIVRHLYKLAMHWAKIDDKHSIESMHTYILRKFLKDALNGLISETKAKDILKKFGLEIEELSGKDDEEKCVDFYVSKNDLKIAIQMKPASFFNGLITTTSASFLKIKTASKRYKLNTLFGVIKNNNLFIVIREKDSDNCKFVPASEFVKIFSTKISPDIISDMSAETFTKMNSDFVALSRRFFAY
jgi:hypothetical protein